MKKIFFLFLIISVGFAQNKTEKKRTLSKPVAIQIENTNYIFEFKSDEIISVTTKKILSNDIKKKVINNKPIQLKHGKLLVKIHKNPFKIEFYNSVTHQLITTQNSDYFKQKHIPLDNVKDNIKADSITKVSFSITNNEILYGGGARVLGMNRRGNRLALFNKAHYGYESHAELMNFNLPIIISSNKYILHFDNPAVGYLDLDSKKNNTISYESVSEYNKTYQLIIGDTFQKLVENYTFLTGRQPIPPRWAFGNFSSRFGYHSENEVYKTIQKYKDEQIPVDAVILDLYWFGKDIKGTMGNLEVFRDSFPNFEQMIKNLAQIGVKTIPITEPFILTTSKKWNEAVENNILVTDSLGKPKTWEFYFGNTSLIDIFKPESKQWFWNIYKDLKNKGVAGVWGDLGEPEMFSYNSYTAAGKAPFVHNIYGHNWAKLIFEGYKNDYPTERPFILMRSGYSGSQKYGIIPWSGDVNRTWGGLQAQPEISLQMGMQGLGYMHSDLGGFAGANLDDELYVRWLQYGVFNPIFRPHAQEEVPSEPVFRSNWAKRLAKQAIELRYKMLPYNYTLAYENSQNGKPLMKPLFFEEPSNQNLYTKADGYMWGDSFLIYPVLEKEQQTKEIYFPNTVNWFDFYTNKIYKKGSTETIKLNENNIPTFVKSGSFIPLYNMPVENTGCYFSGSIDVYYYFDNKTSKNIFYDDDGKTANTFENGTYELIIFESNGKTKKLELKITSELGKNQQPTEREINFSMFNISKKPKNIKVNNKNTQFEYNTKNKTILLKINHITNTKIEIL